MPISNFPAALQPIIQQNYLERMFLDGLRSVLSYRSIAAREKFPNGIGETITKTRPGLKVPVTTPLAPSTNTNLDNGLSPTSWTVEQFTLGINQYGDAIDLNTVTTRVSSVAITEGGLRYALADTLSAAAVTIGGTGSGFEVGVAALSRTDALIPQAWINQYKAWGWYPTPVASWGE